MDLNQLNHYNQAELNLVGNRIIQGGIQKSTHGDVYAVRQNTYRDELDKQVQMKKARESQSKFENWTKDNMHLDTISYAPVGNPNVSSRRSNRGHFQTSYNNHFIGQNPAQEQALRNSQSVPILPGLGALPGSNSTVIMPALGGVQMIGPNGGVSNNLMLPTAGLQNFVPDPSSLVSTNYFGLPAPPGLPNVGPGTTNFPGISVAGAPSSGAQAMGMNAGDWSDPNFKSITKPYKTDNTLQKKAYAEELRRQMIEKDFQNASEKKKAEEWDEYHERRIQREMDLDSHRSPQKTYSKNRPVDPNGPPPDFTQMGGPPALAGSKEQTDQYGWWMSDGPKKRRPQSHGPDYPPPPLPWQVDPENNPKEQFGKDYKEWYDKKAGIEKESEREDVPKSVPAKVSDMVKKHMEMVKHKLLERDEKVKTEMQRVREEVAEKDLERKDALDELHNLKVKLKNQQLDEDIRHNYMYDILFKNWKARERNLKNGDLERKPYKHVFPDLEKVDFRLPEHQRVDDMLGDNKKILNIVTENYVPNEHDVYTIKNDVDEQIDADFNNIDRLNKVNKKRLFDIDKNLPRSSTPDYDELDGNLFSFLDKESVFKISPGVPLAEKEARNELFNKDILKDYDPIDADQFKAPITVFNKIDTQ
ncbi:unnamed protein product [Moneuplotes crassus]|uniref:Uncharacterized protein n=1 Tax=Euplotes crassus TaxID=5936 RepID=A0AAD1YAF6_EUPCR|nr:unnamed protein product [Moneuplotes crassus]